MPCVLIARINLSAMNIQILYADTGNVSFALYGFFIVITVIAMVFGMRQIANGRIPADRLEKMIDLFKYAIVSTAIATTTLIVSNLFKEREQDVKELEYFDKYANDVKSANNVLARLQLSKYFSIVAPEGEMKSAWRSYYDTVKSEYAEYIRTLGVDSQKARARQIVEIAEGSLVDAGSAGMLHSERFVVNANPDVADARSLEREGFLALRREDYAGAARLFTKSENAYNGFHSVYELAKLLRNNATAMQKDSIVKREILKSINDKYSGYAPGEVQTWLQKVTLKNSKALTR